MDLFHPEDQEDHPQVLWRLVGQWDHPHRLCRWHLWDQQHRWHLLVLNRQDL
jgi:hypothetical protein